MISVPWYSNFSRAAPLPALKNSRYSGWLPLSIYLSGVWFGEALHGCKGWDSIFPFLEYYVSLREYKWSSCAMLRIQELWNTHKCRTWKHVVYSVQRICPGIKREETWDTIDLLQWRVADLGVDLRRFAPVPSMTPSTSSWTSGSKLWRSSGWKHFDFEASVNSIGVINPFKKLESLLACIS